MNHKHCRRALALAVIICSPLALAGCGQESDQVESEPTPIRTIAVEPYKVDSSVPSAVNFFDNQNVFEGTVIKVLSNVRVVDVMDDGMKFEAVYTPAIMRVETSFGGDLMAGDEILVRVMGGQADGLDYEMDSSPKKSTFEVGNELMVFAGEISTVKTETDKAITPYFVYQHLGDLYVDATYGDGPANGGPVSKIKAAELRPQVEAAEAAKTEARNG